MFQEPESLDPEKEQLKTEVKVLREEFQHVQKGVEIIETLLRGSAPKPSDAQVLNQRLSELKSHVHACQNGNRGALGVQPMKNNDAKSLHEDIMKQSENVLNILRENGALPEQAEIEGPSINWTEVQKSIEKQLSKETERKISVTELTDKVEKIDDKASMPVENRTSKALPQTVSHLAEAIESELGMKVNIVIEPVPNQTPVVNLASQPDEDVIAQTLGKKYKLDHDKMNKEYEELRKKRLAMLVQAYTGKNEKEMIPKSLTSPRIEEKLASDKELTEVEKIIVNHLGEEALVQQKSTDTSAVKERLRLMREQLNKKDPKPDETVFKAEANITQREKPPKSEPVSIPRQTQKKRELPERPKGIAAVSSSPKREIFPHKKGYMSEAKFYELNGDETESVTTDAGPVSGEDLESLVSDTDPMNEVSDPRATSLYQRTYSKGRSPPTKHKNRSSSPSHKGLASGSPITQSFHQLPSQQNHDEFHPVEGNRLSMSLTELNSSDEKLDSMGKEGVRSFGTLKDKYGGSKDYRRDDLRYSRDNDGYYSSSTKLKATEEKRRDWAHDTRDTMDSVFSDAYDKLDSCGCSHKDLRCSHLELHKGQISYSNYKSIPARSTYSDKPKQENIVGGLPLRDDQYGSRTKLHGPKPSERSQGSRERLHDSRERSHDSRERSHDSRERSHDPRERLHESRHDFKERSHDTRERPHDSRHDFKERSHDTRERPHDSRQDFKERSHDTRERPHDFRERSHDSRELAYDTRERSHDSKERSYDHRSPLRDKRSHDVSPKRLSDERPPIPSEKDYQELRSQIRRIFSESTLDKDTPIDYDSVTGSPRYKSQDTLYRDSKKHTENPREADRYPGSPDTRRRHKQRDDHYSAYDQPFNSPRSSGRIRDERSRDDREKYPVRPRSEDKSIKPRDETPENYNHRPRSVGNSTYTPLRDEKYNLRPRSVDKTPSSGLPDDLDEIHNLRPRSVDRGLESHGRKSSSVASSETDFVVLGSGEIVNRKAKSSRPTIAELEEPKWTEPKRRFLPPTDSVRAPETYWKEPKRYVNEGAGYANEGVGYAKDGSKAAPSTDKWGSRNMERRREGDGKEVNSSSWYRCVDSLGNTYCAIAVV